MARRRFVGRPAPAGPSDPSDIATERAFVQSLVVYEDRTLLAFDKPPGLAVQGGSGVSRDLDRLARLLARSADRPPRLVHRLDRATSGIVLMARTKPAAAHLSAQFADRTVSKTYWAVTSAEPPAAEGSVDLPLVRMRSSGTDMTRPARPGEADAMPARTMWRVLTAGRGGALLEVRPETGRLHQIRAHMAAIHMPLAGDARYGGLGVIGGCKAGRVMLHAAMLDFVHPALETRIALRAPLPADMAGLLSGLGLPSPPEPDAIPA